VERKRQQRRASEWAFAPEMKGGHTTGGLEWALSILNQEDLYYTEMRRELRALVAEWQACGQSFWKMIRKDCERAAALQTGWIAFFGADGKFLIGRDERSQDTSPRGVALTAFASLMNDPDLSLLGGPCDRCGRYFKKKRANHKLYCDRDCAHLASATKSTNERLQRDREDKLKRAKLRIAQWQGLKRKPKVGWKKWIATAVPDLSVTFLTRAVNSGDLVPPTDSAKERDYAKG
jgi:hypothetical protein